MGPTHLNSQISPEGRAFLIDLAKKSIRSGLLEGKPFALNLNELSEELIQPRAAFVTLQKYGDLRGCIGSLEAHRPLAEDVSYNAYAAAFYDPRFPSVSADEIALLDIHISILTPAVQMNFKSEQDLIAQLKPGVDGLILEEKSKRGTFLPSVWEALPEPCEFLSQLKRKAGLPADYWSDTLKVYRYGTETIP